MRDGHRPAGFAALESDLRGRAFAPAAHGRRIGGEAELIALHTDTRLACPLTADEGPATLPFVRRYGAHLGWTERSSAKGVPSFTLPDRGTLTFEPGGQLEYSSPPLESASALIASLRDFVLPLRTAARDEGIELLAAGLDPLTPLERVPLQLRADRYERMDAYFATIGLSGARMMRQTASIQVSLDLGDAAAERWRVASALAPYVIAIFANSPLASGRVTGHQSTRAHMWRTLDPRRTGLPGTTGDAAARYLAFALDAPTMLLDGQASAHPTFREILGRGDVTWHDWDVHLGTLFPEVRPRGYLEVRSCDAIDPHWYAAPIALLAGILYDGVASRAAHDLLVPAEPALLARAGEAGLRDGGMASVARDLFAIALDGCRRLGPAFLGAADLERAEEFARRYTFRGRSPADDVLANTGAWSSTAADPRETSAVH